MKLSKKLVAAVTTAGLIVGMTGVASADWAINSIENDIDAAREEKAVTVGGTTTVDIWVRNQNTTSGDSVGGCNLGGSDTSITLGVASTDTAVATVSPATITIDSCDLANGKTVTINGVANGPADINFTLVSKQPSNLEGNFNLDGAQFKAKVGTGVKSVADACDSVSAPATPVFTAPVAPASGWFRTVPTAAATSSTAGATLSYATGTAPTPSDFVSTVPTLGEGTTDVTAKATSATCSKSSTASRQFKVDTVNPTVTPGNVTNSTWRNTDLAQAFTAEDVTSDLANAADASFTLTASAESADADTPTVVSKTVSDNAGNSTTRSVSARIDKTDPVVSGSNVTNTTWRNTPLSYDFTASDVLSGLANAADESFTLSASDESADAGTPTVASKTVLDNAGNSTTRTVSALIDTTDPTITCSTPAPVYTLNQSSPADVTASISDGLSGAVSSSGSAAPNVGSVGSKSVTITGTDNAGNEGSASCSYSVIYNWTGFFQPVDNPTYDGTTGALTNHGWNKAKAGSAIPVKFNLGGNQGLNIFEANYPKAVPVACTTGASSGDAVEETVTANSSGLKYDSDAQQYVYVWKTTSTYAGKCYRLDVKLIDGTTHSAYFNLTK